jgi:hypothetical protein
MVAPPDAPSEWFVSDIFQEIEEELRRENFAKLWTRYGKYVIALAVLVVIAVGGFSAWRQYQLHQRQSEGVRYAEALDLARQGKDKDAAAAFAALARQAGGGHAVLARLEEGAIRARSGDVEGAIAVYNALAADGSADPMYRDLGTVLASLYGLKSGDPKAIVERLAPLTGPGNPWHATALELTALAKLKAGDKTEARTIYQRLADDLTAPQGLRARAAEMVAALAE